MEITEVKVFPVREEKLKAFVSIVFDRCFMVNDIKIINGRDGLFISMPSRKKKNGDYKDVAHPLNNETRGRIQGRILDEYRQMVGEAVVEPRRERNGVEAVPVDEATAAAAATVPAAAARPAAAPEPPKEDERETQTAAPSAPEDRREGEKNEEKTLDEVTEEFSSESFWTA